MLQIAEVTWKLDVTEVRQQRFRSTSLHTPTVT